MQNTAFKFQNQQWHDMTIEKWGSSTGKEEGARNKAVRYNTQNKIFILFIGRLQMIKKTDSNLNSSLFY